MKKLVYSTLALFVSSFVVEAQTQTENYVKTTTYQVETPDGNVSDDHKIESVTYYDGLGRPIQSVAQRVGGNKEDLISPIYYDHLGRTPKNWLPLAVDNNPNGEYYDPQTSLTTEIINFYKGKFPEDFYQGNNLIPDYDNPYGEHIYENSPLSRVQKVGAPGFDWNANYSDHTVKFEYEANESGDVYFFSVNLDANYTPSLVFNTTYKEGELFKSVVKDENWTSADGIYGITYEFTNKSGQVVLKRKTVFDPNLPVNDPNYHDTYYVYDRFGNLTYVLSPQGSEKIVVNGVFVSNPERLQILDNLCYQYKYDARNRLTEKHIPGREGWEHILYDKLDRPILTQDPNMQVDGNKWMFTKYDIHGRIAYTGILSNHTKSSLVSQLESNSLPLYETQSSLPYNAPDGTQMNYGNDAFPQNNIEIHTINYYDTYVDYSGLTIPTMVYDEQVTTNLLGFPTVSKVRVLDTNPAHWLTSLTTYDEDGQVIYGDTKNTYLETRDIVKSKLDFVGKTLESENQHFKTGQNNVTTTDYLSYDHIGRLITHLQEIDDSPVQLIAQNSYDELGQLVNKKVGGEVYENGYTDLQGVSVDTDGYIFKTSGSTGWNAGLETKGALTDDGGVSFMVPQTGEIMNIGLNDESNNVGAGELDYYIRIRYDSSTGAPNFRCYARTTPNSGPVLISSTIPYVAGDTFTVERDGQYIRFIHNNSVVISQQLIAAYPSFIGDISFYSPNSKIKDLQLYATDIKTNLQKVDFNYNIRGWLTDINDIDQAGHAIYTDLFNFRINYNKVEGTNNGTPLFNGNIAQTLWKSANTDQQVRGYNYAYDDLNRIKEARSFRGNSVQALSITDTHTLSDVSYDLNGNILALKRLGADINNNTADLWDNLSYEYETIGNKLVNVTDASTHITYKDFGFKDGNTSNLDDYQYDDNGNMVIDRNKGVDNITYNHLNLPTLITVDNTGENGTISYIYDALGMKLEKNFSPAGVNSTNIKTQYANGFVYGDEAGTLKLQFFGQPEGYIKPVTGTADSVLGFSFTDQTTTYSDFKYVFQYTDHLGNIRLSYSDSDLNGDINPATEIIEENNYYPFGLRQRGYNNIITSNGNGLAQQFKYNGTELNENLNLGLYEMPFRTLDPAIARWTGIDPVTHFSASPYNSHNNNPVFWSDPSGADGEAMDSFNKFDQLGAFYGWNNCANCGFAASAGGLVSDPTPYGHEGLSMLRAAQNELAANTGAYDNVFGEMLANLNPDDIVIRMKDLQGNYIEVLRIKSKKIKKQIDLDRTILGPVLHNPTTNSGDAVPITPTIKGLDNYLNFLENTVGKADAFIISFEGGYAIGGGLGGELDIVGFMTGDDLGGIFIYGSSDPSVNIGLSADAGLQIGALFGFNDNFSHTSLIGFTRDLSGGDGIGGSVFTGANHALDFIPRSYIGLTTNFSGGLPTGVRFGGELTTSRMRLLKSIR